MFDALMTVLSILFEFIKIPVFILAVCFGFFAILFLLNVFFLHLKGYRFKRGTRVRVKKSNFFKKIFCELPRQYALDMYERNPDEFRYKGLIVYTGRQGYGKTISLVNDLSRMQKEYPLCKVMTNFAYLSEDVALNHWKQLIGFKNGINGVIVGMDEMQNWFSSNQSKNFPPEMLQEITQNRKQRRIILGTAQNFYLLSKAIRSQCTEVRECFTVLGCLTFVRCREPILDTEGNVVEMKNRGVYFYVHTPELRKSYDTYRVIESLSKSGFQDKRDIVVKVGL